MLFKNFLVIKPIIFFYPYVLRFETCLYYRKRISTCQRRIIRFFNYFLFDINNTVKTIITTARLIIFFNSKSRYNTGSINNGKIIDSYPEKLPSIPRLVLLNKQVLSLSSSWQPVAGLVTDIYTEYPQVF